jgi:hypothetical protein
MVWLVEVKGHLHHFSTKFESTIPVLTYVEKVSPDDVKNENFFLKQ